MKDVIHRTQKMRVRISVMLVPKSIILVIRKKTNFMFMNALSMFMMIYGCMCIFKTNLPDLNKWRTYLNLTFDGWRKQRFNSCTVYFLFFCSCHPVAYLKETNQKCMFLHFPVPVIPEVLKKDPADSSTSVKHAFFLLGLCCESVLRKSIIHFTARVTNSVSLVFPLLGCP